MTGIVAFVSTVPANYVIGKKRGFIAKNSQIFDFYGLIIHKGRGKAVTLRLRLS
jgi:hypothetical protein